MWTAIVIMVLAVAAGVMLVAYGREKQKRKQAEAAAKIHEEFAKIDNRPDLDRDTLYNRLRGKE